MHFIHRCASVFLVAMGLFACQSGTLDVGQAVINPQELLIQSIDTVTVKMSTVLAPDSFVTYADTNIMVGRWNDATTGVLTARGFTTVDYVSNDLVSQSNLRLDSLVLEMGYSFAYGDTTSAYTLNVHQLSNSLSANTVYYNTSSVSYNPTPLMTRTVVPRPRTNNRLIRFRLTDAMASAFFARLIDGSISDATTMVDYWKGFAFTSSSAGNILAGFGVNNFSSLRLYYHNTNLERTASSIRFPLRSTHFTQLLNDRSKTVLNKLQSRADAVSSDQTDRSTTVALGAGLRTRIEFPYIDQFYQPGSFAGVNSALLVLQPIRRTLRDNTTPPNQLALYETNNQNELLSAVPATASGGSQAIVSYFYDANAVDLTDTYTFDLTQYIGNLITRKTPNRPLILTVPTGSYSLATLAQRVSIGDAQRSGDRVRLRLFTTQSL